MASCRILALVATIPPRRASCERLLAELSKQSRLPDGVILCLDGYGQDPAPACSLPVIVYSTAVLSGGPGHRWILTEWLGAVGRSRQRVRDLLSRGEPLDRCWYLIEEQLAARPAVLLRGPPGPPLAPGDLLISIDDDADLSEAPHFLRSLVEAAEQHGGAAAAMGYTPDGHRAGPGPSSHGPLILGCGCGLALRAGHLVGLQALAAEVVAAGGPDALGPLGDDQALVSAHLWRQSMPIWHAATGPLHFAEGTDRSSQDLARKEAGERTRREQAHQIAQITRAIWGPAGGWPFPSEAQILRHLDVQRVQALDFPEDKVLSAVPLGAVKAKGGQPVPAGHVRRLVVDEGEPERSGVYDVPGGRGEPAL